MEENKTTNVNVDNGAENQEVNPPEQKPEENNVVMVKPSLMDRAYAKYCERRRKKLEKKANKTPMTKAQKAGIAVGAGAIGLAVLGGLGKAFVDKYAGGDTYELEDGDIRMLEDSGSEETLIPEPAEADVES